MIEIEYIVRDRRGVERLRTADKKAAEAYDRILENAERLADWLRAGSVLPSLPDDELETLTVHLARHAREVELILKGKPVESGADPVVSEPAPRVTPIKATG
ncbi:YebG family protein [Allochromatium vinosum]|uniref:YebG family protein n=1 Tax=Allochromatium vinosum (strain ATCC 17899 / DSM 180 / NBRC 103801 / NCIMB 10441 / D) TaxID=572477 RepID=D3RRM8_ALLVD|nr:YebG family protein [Allochromatium vinosum]ADC61932.1 YebG family protein [Allochromatium vinosum DSM 180]